jgi:hypothetical protein
MRNGHARGFRHVRKPRQAGAASVALAQKQGIRMAFSSLHGAKAAVGPLHFAQPLLRRTAYMAIADVTPGAGGLDG